MQFSLCPPLLKKKKKNTMAGRGVSLGRINGLINTKTTGLLPQKWYQA